MKNYSNSAKRKKKHDSLSPEENFRKYIYVHYAINVKIITKKSTCFVKMVGR